MPPTPTLPTALVRLRLLRPQSVLSWQRARVASFLSASGQEWVGHMEVHNSGTGNNQWMVVDLKRFSPGRELQPGLLWVVEQAPGLVVASDVTMTLERGYWPSYNVSAPSPPQPPRPPHAL